MENETCSCLHCNHQICAERVPIFSALDSEELNKVVRLIVRKKYSKGEIIFLEGSNLESLIIINSGKVKAFRYNQDGKEQILYIFSNGDFFGEKNLLMKQEATYNVEALEETNICMINKDHFQKLLREHPDIGIKIIYELSSRLERLEKTIQNMGTKNIEARISFVLLEFSKKYGKPHSKGILVELPFSREGIANYIGVARETVSRKLSNLQDAGTIEMIGNKKIIIIDEESLRIEAE